MSEGIIGDVVISEDTTLTSDLVCERLFLLAGAKLNADHYRVSVKRGIFASPEALYQKKKDWR